MPPMRNRTRISSFEFNVALYEPQVIEAQSLLETVHELATLVERIVAAIAPRLQ